jgi:hypothetical protein
MENKRYAIPLLLIAIVGICVLVGMPAQGGIMGDVVHYTGVACVSAMQSGVYHDYGCQHNLITTQGKDLIKWAMIANATSGTIKLDKIGIANITSPQLASDVDLGNLRAGCGLGIATGTLASGSPGAANWSSTYTWTSSCDGAVINATGIYNTTSTGHLFAEANFTSITLNNLDQLTINYFMWTS